MLYFLLYIKEYLMEFLIGRLLLQLSIAKNYIN